MNVQLLTAITEHASGVESTTSLASVLRVTLGFSAKQVNVFDT